MSIDRHPHSEIVAQVTAEFEADFGEPRSDVVHLARLIGLEKRVRGVVARLRQSAQSCREEQNDPAIDGRVADQALLIGLSKAYEDAAGRLERTLAEKP